MKKILLSITTFLTAYTMQAQVREGTITYERKINMHKRITDEQMRAMIPEFRTSKYELLFSDSTSLYRAVPEDNAPDPFAGSGGQVVFRMGADAGQQYRNFANAKMIESRELGAKTYIIEDSIKQLGWKVSDETKTILNYPCKKATFKTEKGQNIEAWYTESIPCPAGPESYASLPGAILQLDVNQGEIVYTAVSISDKVDKSEIKEPKKGKKIARADFMKMMQEMMGNPGSGSRVIRIGG